ncbi:MAG: hypothetical protein HOM97_12880 [Nitrospina sp.]|nr:hypothetical protein [Nitrospina sp.]
MFNAGLSEGLLFFHKTGATLYGYFLELLGWDYSKGQVLSFMLMGISGFFWFLILRKLEFDLKSRITFLLLFFYMEFSFTATNSIRYETLVLALQSFALYLFFIRKFFLVGLISVIAIECHPIAIMNLTYLLGLILSNHGKEGFTQFFKPSHIQWQPIFYFSVGCLIGVLYYFSLHPLPFTKLYDFLFLNSVQGVGKYQDTKLGALGLYYFKAKFYRHLPELFIIFIALSIYLYKKKYKEKLYLLLWVVMLVILNFLRPIQTYVAIIYPAFIVLMVASFHSIKKLNLLLIIFITLMVPQYFGVYYLNKDWDRKNYVADISKLVPKDGLPVIGSAISWHALKERKNYKAAIYPVSEANELEWKELYFVEDYFIREKEEYIGTLAYLDRHYNFSIVETSNATGKPIVLKKLTRK